MLSEKRARDQKLCILAKRKLISFNESAKIKREDVQKHYGKERMDT
jgi:hypothetical protein